MADFTVSPDIVCQSHLRASQRSSGDEEPLLDRKITIPSGSHLPQMSLESFSTKSTSLAPQAESLCKPVILAQDDTISKSQGRVVLLWDEGWERDIGHGLEMLLIENITLPGGVTRATWEEMSPTSTGPHMLSCLARYAHRSNSGWTVTG